MDPYQDRRTVTPRYKKSRSAQCLLVLCGAATMFFALVLIGCSFAINYDEDFELDDKLEARIKIHFNYMQYWAGVPFFVTGTLVLISGVYQRSRGLTITSVIFCLLSVVLTLFVLVLEGENFAVWNSEERSKAYWDSKSGYTCGTNKSSKTCQCSTSSSSEPITISDYECNVVRKFSAFYGVVTASAIMVTFFALSAIVVIVKSLSWKRLVYAPPLRSYYNSADEFYVDTGRRTPSYIDIPVAKREDDRLEMSNGNKPALPYRNYPF